MSIEACSPQLPEVSTAPSSQANSSDTMNTGSELPQTSTGDHHASNRRSDSQLSFHLPEVDAHINISEDPLQQQGHPSSGHMTGGPTDSEKRHDAPACHGAIRGLAPTSGAAHRQPVTRDFRLLLHRLDAFQPRDLFLGEYVLLGRGHRRQGGALPACTPHK